MDINARIRKNILAAAKIAVGSCAAMYIATLLNLEFASSAGSIAMLTILTTKWETLRLSIIRIITFFITVVLSYIFFEHIPIGDWAAYGIFMGVMCIMLEILGWRAALSVNAVICTHFLTTDNFTPQFILNEFLIVILGISIAIILNLFHDNSSQKRVIINMVTSIEAALTGILGKIACYLQGTPINGNVWEDIKQLEKELEESVSLAHEYQNNTFSSQPGYYIDYFEMRIKQLNVLHNLHYELKRIREMPKQAEIVADYILYLKNFVTEMNDPIKQMERLQMIFESMKEEELPKTREEFENRAKLYHILMDLEEFLIFKRRFIVSAQKGELKNTTGVLEKNLPFKIKRKK